MHPQGVSSVGAGCHKAVHVSSKKCFVSVPQSVLPGVLARRPAAFLSALETGPDNLPIIAGAGKSVGEGRGGGRREAESR